MTSYRDFRSQKLLIVMVQLYSLHDYQFWCWHVVWLSLDAALQREKLGNSKQTTSSSCGGSSLKSELSKAIREVHCADLPLQIYWVLVSHHLNSHCFMLCLLTWYVNIGRHIVPFWILPCLITSEITTSNQQWSLILSVTTPSWMTGKWHCDLQIIVLRISLFVLQSAIDGFWQMRSAPLGNKTTVLIWTHT